MKGRGDFANMFVLEIAPGKSTAPQRHLYEEVVYVLEGSGSTQLEFSDGTKRSFEWGARSLFAIPLNARHRHFNASGRERALLVSTTNLPMVLNVFHSEAFVFGSEFDFVERAGKKEYFAGEGDLITVRPGNHMWETNFVPDLAAIELKSWGDRGAGGTNIMFVLADGTMHAHISEMPVGTYKKGHRHGPSFHVMCVTGQGFSLMWYEGDQDFRRIDWKHGVVLAPGDRQFHQHFNTGPRPARYLATAMGGLRYPTTTANRVSLLGAKEGDKPAVSKSVKEGGDQIEYEDQDPRIHAEWLDEMKAAGVEPRMGKFFK
jgi:quercetin dioxygenase-like cupin family protein